MNISAIKSKWESGQCVQSSSIMLVDMVKKPLRVSSKDNAPLFNLTNRTSQYRCQTEVESYNGLLLDYDSGITIDEVHNSLKDYRHIIYTSYSHKPDHHKFRVILPTDEPINKKLYHHKAWKHAIADRFDGVDSSSASPDRFFYVPCLTPHYKYLVHPVAQLWHPQHDKLFWDSLTHQAEIERQNNLKWSMRDEGVIPIYIGNLQVGTYGFEQNKDWTEVAIQKQLDRMNSLAWNNRGYGGVHESICTVVSALKHLGLSSQEIEQYLSPWEHKAHRGEIKNIIRGLR